MRIDGGDVAIVVIGRNEGERLKRSLAALAGARRVVYVDSGSSDDSLGTAARFGASLVSLDSDKPFTAARARNCGLERALEMAPGLQYVQFLDGDCEMDGAWIGKARAALDDNPRFAAVFGRLRERHPEKSAYNWLCDVEWAVPPGPARASGGNAMFRLEALREVGGFDPRMIAGEEPDLCLRLRARGWTIYCLPEEMALHDAAMTRFGQWWRRSRRAGYAMADLTNRHRGSHLHNYRRSLASSLLWGASLPLAFGAALLIGLLGAQIAGLAAAVGLVLIVLLQILRLARRESRSRPAREAWLLAAFLILCKPAQAIGIAQFALDRLTGRLPMLIEYKAVDP